MAHIFVAVEVGFWTDPKNVSFGRAIGNRLGAALILQLREFFLNHGTRGILPKKYSADDIAAALGWEGRTPKLIAALRGSGHITRKRGRFVYPEWGETSTGWWEGKKARDRRRKRVEDEHTQRGGSAEAPRNLRANSSEIPEQTSNQGAAGSGGGPPAGPPLGGDLAASRLGWLEDNYPLGLVNPEMCAGLVGAMSQADWDHLKYAVLYKYSKKNPSFVPPAERFLGKQLYRLVRRPKAVKPRVTAERLPTAEELAAIEEQKRRDEEQIADFKRLGDIKARLRAKGLRGIELEERALEEFDREHQPTKLEVVR